MKDTYKAFNPIEVEAVAAYREELERRQQRKLDAITAVSVFALLGSAADPSSAQEHFTHWVPDLVFGTLLSLAAAASLGII